MSSDVRNENNTCLYKIIQLIGTYLMRSDAMGREMFEVTSFSKQRETYLKSDMKKIKEKNYMDHAFLVFANERLTTFEKV